jgi:hypothetical protein
VATFLAKHLQQQRLPDAFSCVREPVGQLLCPQARDGDQLVFFLRHRRSGSVVGVTTDDHEHDLWCGVRVIEMLRRE